MKLQKALTYLDNVTKKSMAVPMRRYAGSTGRTAQGEFRSKFSLHAG
jgi:large subunit ribosomal protein L17e